MPRQAAAAPDAATSAKIAAPIQATTVMGVETTFSETTYNLLKGFNGKTPGLEVKVEKPAVVKQD